LETTIPYKLSESAHVVLSIYNIRGQLVRRCDIGVQEAGAYIEPERAAHWDGRNELGEKVATGIYFYTMNCRLASEQSSEQSGNYTVIRKLAVISNN